VSASGCGDVPAILDEETAMGVLRKQMDGDLVVRGMSVRTREAYVGAVAKLAKYYGRSPDRISEQEVQNYLLHLIEERKLSWSSCNIAAQGLRFFYRVTLKRSEAQFAVQTYWSSPFDLTAFLRSWIVLCWCGST
jgi:site-specific recombinase XerD